MKMSTPRRAVPELRQFIADHGEDAVTAAARGADTSVAYLYQLAGGHRIASAELAKRIEHSTCRSVLRAHLRPDLFGDLQQVAEPDAQAS